MSQRINLNTTPNQFMPILYFSQGDIGRTFEIALTSSDGYSIPIGATVEMVATKPSGFGFTVSGSLTGNVATFVTTETMTSEWGRFPAEIVIKNNGDVIGTANFYLNGERNPHPEGTIDGDASTIIPQLTLLVERVETAASSVLDRQTVTQTLPAGSQASYSFDEETNTQTFGIPQGEAGAGAVDVTASAYSSSKTYAVGDYVIHNDYLYRCTTAITTAEAWTSGHWTQVLLGDEVSNLKSASSYLSEALSSGTVSITDLTWESNKGVIADSSLADFGATNNSSVLDATGFISIPKQVYIVECRFPTYPSTTTFGFVFYDSTKQPIKGYVLDVTGGFGSANKKFYVPNGAKFFKTVWFHDTATYGTFSGNFYFNGVEALSSEVAVLSNNFENDVVYDGGSYHATVERGSYSASDGSAAFFENSVRTKYKQQIRDYLVLNLLNDNYRAAVYWYTESESFIQRSMFLSDNATSIDFNKIRAELGLSSATHFNIVFFRWNGVEAVTDKFITEQELASFNENYIFEYGPFSTKDAVRRSDILIAASNSNTPDRAVADYLCTGTNDEVVIQTAVNNALNSGKKIILAEGDYYIDSFPNSEGYGVLSAVHFGANAQQNVVIEGAGYGASRKEGTANQFIGGAIIHVSDTCYNSLDSNSQYAIFASVSDGTTRKYPWTKVNIENISFVLPDNQKKIICIDGWMMSALSFKNIYATAVADAYNLKVAVDGCIGIRGLQGSNAGINNRWETSFVWGFYEGYAVSGEHIIGVDLGSRFCNYGFTFNRKTNAVGAWIHPITMINCCDECNFNLPVFGNSGESGKSDGLSGRQTIDLIDYNLEWLSEYSALGGNLATELNVGQTYGSITFTEQPSYGGNSKNNVAAKFWADGYGHNMKTVNMAHAESGTSAERETYHPQYMQKYFDTTLNKLLIYNGSNWVDTMGNLLT